MGGKLKFGLVVAVLAGAAGAANHYGMLDTLVAAAPQAPQYRLAAATRGSISSTVSASGTLKAVVTVNVGTQVSGMVKTLKADFNSKVEAGQVIARIDSAPFEANLSQAEAELAVARATVELQEASLVEFEADLDGFRAAVAESAGELERKRELFRRKVEPQSAVSTALARYEQTNSKVNAGLARLVKQQAQIQIARALVQQKSAVVQQRRLDLEYTYIRSPVSGVVISRNVDAGQTVAASLQSPILFRIAQDLAQLEVSINVDEADIGQIREDQRVMFAVDSYPGRWFEGNVLQIRQSSREISNVVTYTVVASADNLDHALLPGMTANVTVFIQLNEDTLKVPSSARRLRLPDAEGGRPRLDDWVWVMGEDGRPKPVSIKPGITNANSIEIVNGEIAEGQKVIVGVAAPKTPEPGKWLRFGF